MESRILLLLLIACLSNSALSAPQKAGNGVQEKSPTHAKILKQINKINDDGSYTFGYEADDGSFKVETRSKDGVVKGKYGFVDANGQLKTIEYSAGQRQVNDQNNRDINMASATDSNSKSVKADSAEDENGENENGSAEEAGNSSKESGEDEATFNSFGNQSPRNQKAPELSQRQGTADDGGDAKYVRQSQIQQPQYIPGGQFRGPVQQQYLDPRLQQQQQFRPQPQYIGGQGQPQYINSGPQYINGPPQFPGGFGGPQQQQQFIGQPGQFQGQGQAFGRGPQQQGRGQFVPQYQQQQDEDGFVTGPPPSNFFGGPAPQQQGQQQSFGIGRPVQGFPASQQQQQYEGNGIGAPQQFGGRPDRFGSSGVNGNEGSSRPFSSSADNDGPQEYVPNPELDGFSEDSDQDGFVDNFGGSRPRTQGNSGTTPGRATVIQTPSSEGQYRPQPLGPQQVLGQGQSQGQGSLRPGSQIESSPYDDQDLQQIYQQPGPGPQFGPSGAGRQFQGSPPFQQFGPQDVQFRPQTQFSPQQQFSGQGGRFQFAPQPGQFNGGGFPGQQFQGQGQAQILPQYVQGAGQQFSPQAGGFQGQGPQFSLQGGGFQGQGPQFSPQAGGFQGQGPQFSPQAGGFQGQGPQFSPQGGGFQGQAGGFQGQGPQLSSQGGGFQGQNSLSPQAGGLQGQDQSGSPLQYSRFVGGVGPGGFPIGGPLQPQQLTPQQQQQYILASQQGGQGQGQSLSPTQLSPTPGAVQVVTPGTKSAN